MPPIVHYSSASLLYILLAVIFYGKQRHVSGLRTRFFEALLYVAFAESVLSVVTAIIGATGAGVPPVLSSVLEVVLYAVSQLGGPIFLCYSIALTGNYRASPGLIKAAVYVPYAVAMFFVISSLFSNYGVFCVDDAGRIAAGPSFAVIYIVVAAYIVLNLAYITVFGKSLQSDKRAALYFILGCSAAALLIRLIWPEQQLGTVASALAVTVVFNVLQPSSEHVDPLTKMYNKAAVPALLRDLYDRGQRFSVIILQLDSLHLINYTLGVDRGDTMLSEFSKALQDRFPGTQIARIGGNTFAIFDSRRDREITMQELGDIITQLENPETGIAGGSKSAVLAAAVSSERCSDGRQMLDVIDYIYHNESSRETARCIVIDDEYVEKCRVRKATEDALERVLNERRVQVHYQPIHSADGRLVALEALCRIEDPEMGRLSPDVFIPIAEQNGAIHRLGEQVIEKVCAFIRAYAVDRWGLDHIGVNLSIAQCVTDDLAQTIIRLAGEYKVSPGLLSFEITETATASSMPAVRRNMSRLREAGFSFLLDDFGSGYANFDYIAALPFSCVKIDKSILWESGNGKRQMAFLRGVNDLIHRLGLKSLCEGAETQEHIDLLRRIGVDMTQGYYYSKALPEKEMAEYAGRAVR